MDPLYLEIRDRDITREATKGAEITLAENRLMTFTENPQSFWICVDGSKHVKTCHYPLVNCYITMENHHF